MKRKAKKIEQKAWKWENMYPQFVSIVETGANYIPFSSIKFSDSILGDQFSEGYDIAKIVFTSKHTSQHAKQFLEEKNVVDYELKEDESGRIYVDNPDIESFSDVKVITMEDGLEIHVGKTPKATIQSKTKIEDAEPIIKMEETAQENSEIVSQETVALGGKLEETDSTADVATKEADESDVEEVEVAAQETVEVETSESTESVSNKFSNDEKFSTLFNAMVKARMSENDFTEYVDARKAWITMDLLSYKLMDSVYYALQEEDKDAKVMEVVTQFGEAILKIYNALDSVNMSSNEEDEEEDEDLDQTGAQIIGEEEPEVVLQESTDNSNEVITKLSEEMAELKRELDEIKKQKEIDSEIVLVQASKADVSAFDKSSTLEDNQPKVHSKNTKNLFGL